MRVVQLITRSDSVGGAQVHVAELSRGLLDLGHDVIVLAGGEGPYANFLMERGVPYKQVPNLRRDINPVTDSLAYREILAELAALRPDIVALHSSKAGVIGRLAARTARIPAVFTAHGWAFADGVAGWKRASYTYIERKVAPLAQRIITVSEYDRKLALERCVGTSEQLVAIHNGVRDTPNRAHPGEHKIPQLVMVARFEEPKDQVSVLRAFAALRRKAHLTFVGDGPNRVLAEEMAVQLGIRQNVTFLGSRSDVPQILASMDIFVLATHSEGLPLSILEAMRAGLPVVASDVGGVAETVVDGENGYLVPALDTACLSERLGRLMADSRISARFGEKSRQLYEANFTFEHMIDRTLDVYQQVAHYPTSHVMG